MRRARHQVLAAVLGTVAAILPAFLTGAIGVQLSADFHVDAAALGAAVATYFAAAALASARMGRTVERLGPRRSLQLTSTAAVGVCLGLAASPGYGALVAWLLVGGTLNAAAQPAANLMLARAVVAERQGVAFGIKQSAMPAAALLGGLAVPTIALTVGWRWAYVGAACVALGAAAFVTATTAPPEAAGGRRHAPADVEVRRLLLLAAGVGFGAASAGALATFLVLAGVEAGLGEGAAGWSLTGGSAVGIAVRLWVGVRADRRTAGHLTVVAAMLVGGALSLLLLATGGQVSFVLAVPFAFGLGWAWPGLFNYAVVRRHPDAAGRATGITQTGTYIGAVAGPLAFGAIADAWGYGGAWTAAAGWYLLAALAMYLGGRQRADARVR